MEQGENSEVSMGFDSENSRETVSDKVGRQKPLWRKLARITELDHSVSGPTPMIAG